MANKQLATRQKMHIKVEPSQAYSKPRNPVAVAAKARAGGAGPHRKGPASKRQAEKRELEKAKLTPEDD